LWFTVAQGEYGSENEVFFHSPSYFPILSNIKGMEAEPVPRFADESHDVSRTSDPDSTAPILAGHVQV
jgi:hypothetical protein